MKSEHMFEKSNETEEHSERLARLAKKLGEAMGLSENELDELELVAMLHDIGKISVDKNILTKTGKLSDAEWQEIKKHPEVGYRIANSTSGLSHIAEYILCHHEYWDGSGYPLGLSGKSIPLLSRIITVVDAYDAMNLFWKSDHQRLSHSQRPVGWHFVIRHQTVWLHAIAGSNGIYGFSEFYHMAEFL